MFTVTIDTNNDAFTDDYGKYEIARILYRLSEKLRESPGGIPHGTLRDCNGNTCGEWCWDTGKTE